MSYEFLLKYGLTRDEIQLIEKMQQQGATETVNAHWWQATNCHRNGGMDSAGQRVQHRLADLKQALLNLKRGKL